MEKSSLEIQIEVDGHIVRGRIATLSERGIDVEIIDPFHDIRQGGSYPVIAMPAVIAGGHAYVKDGELSENGRKCAEGLLEELYRACRVFVANRDVLAEEYQLTRQATNLVAQIGDDLFQPARTQLKKRLKSGEISPGEYQRALAPFARQHEALKLSPHRIESEMAKFVQLRYGILIPYGTMGQLITEFLDARHSSP